MAKIVRDGGQDLLHGFPGAATRRLDLAAVRPVSGSITLAVAIELPVGWKINPMAPMRYLVKSTATVRPIDRASLGVKAVDPPSATFRLTLPATGGGEDTLRLSMNYYSQQAAERLCKMGSVVWTVPLRVSGDAAQTTIVLTHDAHN